MASSLSPIKVGIVGYGFATKCFHLPYILPNAELEVVAFLQRKSAPAPGEAAPKWGHCTVDFPSARHHLTAESFFADEAIELVVICTHRHEEFIEGALRAGKHVVVEKPFVTTSAEADRLIALAKEKGVILTVFQNRRYDSDFRTLQHLLSQGALGDVREAQIHFDYPDPGWMGSWTRPYEPGEGMAFGLGTHSIDQALALFGTPASVTGFLSANRNGAGESDIDDTFTIVLQYGGDRKSLLVQVKTAIVTPLQDQLKFFVRGTRGSYLKFGTDPQEANAIASPGKPAPFPESGTEDPRIWGTLTTKGDTPFDANVQVQVDGGLAGKLFAGKYPSLPGSYGLYYQDVVDTIRGRSEVKVKPETSRDGLRVIELARESHLTGRTMPWS